MKISGLFAAALAAVNLFAATPVATTVTARQRYPWNGKVDIVVTLSGESNDVAQVDCTFAATNKATGAALAIANVERVSGDTGSATTWTRRYVWDATADLGEVKIDAVALSVWAEISLGGVQLWEGGPYWAECNVGATKPEEYGYYFWWGDTVGCVRNVDDTGWVSARSGTSDSFPWSTCPTYGKSPYQLQLAGYTDAAGNFVAKYDAATMNLGSPWRMPTDTEFSAMVDNCDLRYTIRNDACGLLVTGRGAYSTKSIFLPAAGYGFGGRLVSCDLWGNYWSSTPSSDDSDYACDLFFFPSGFSLGDTGRDSGQTVRPLRESAPGLTSGACVMTAELALDTRTGTRYARAEEPIVFDSAWGENVTRLVLNVDGANVLTATTATNGVYVWHPDFSSARDVMLTLTFRGAVNEVLTATFTTATVTEGGAFAFTPVADAAPVSIPYDWLVAAGLAHYGDLASGLAAHLAAPYAPGYTGWEAFVAGLTARDQSFRAEVELKDGEVRISWTPNLNTEAVTRIYTVYGRTNLEEGDWEPLQPWHRFFKVAVALPTGADGEETAASGEGFVLQSGGVQLWEGGPYWAEYNVGASKPEEYGYYFWWGDTVGYTHDGSKWVAVDGSSSNFSFYNWGNENPLIATMCKDVDTLKSEGWIDKDGNLAPAHDAATVRLGAPWRMPTMQELNDLMNNCDWTWTTRNGVYGRLVTGRGGFSTKSIFLPAAGIGDGSYLYDSGSCGCYWSSSPDSDIPYLAWDLNVFPGNSFRYNLFRYYGFPVRPLRGFAK